MSAVSESPIQFFAVAAEHVVCVDRQNKAWLWYGATFEDWKLGVYQVADSGLLDFQPNNEAEDSDGSARR